MTDKRNSIADSLLTEQVYRKKIDILQPLYGAELALHLGRLIPTTPAEEKSLNQYKEFMTKVYYDNIGKLQQAEYLLAQEEHSLDTSFSDTLTHHEHITDNASPILPKDNTSRNNSAQNRPSRLTTPEILSRQQREAMSKEQKEAHDKINVSKYSSISDFNDKIYEGSKDFIDELNEEDDPLGKKDPRYKSVPPPTQRELSQDPTKGLVYFPAGKVLQAFHNSNAGVRVIRGGIGSGKTYANCIDMFADCITAPKDIHGHIRSRNLIVRDTFASMKHSIMSTWFNIHPKKAYTSNITTTTAPATNIINIQNKIFITTVFLGASNLSQAEKVRSTDFSKVFLNEVQLIDLGVVGYVRGRAGRYPESRLRPDDVLPEDWVYKKRISMDANAGSMNSWLYDFEVKHEWRKDFHTGLLRPLHDIEECERWEFFIQPPQDSDEAENVIGHFGCKFGQTQSYYKALRTGMDERTFKRDVLNQYTAEEVGKSAYGDVWNKLVHTMAYSPNSRSQLILGNISNIILGLDVGNTPACCVVVQNSSGNWIVLKEYAPKRKDHINFEDFIMKIKEDLISEFKVFDVSIVPVFIDPASASHSALSNSSYFSKCKQLGLNVKIANNDKSNDTEVRRLAVKELLRDVTGLSRTLTISEECNMLIEGFDGAYGFAKRSVGSMVVYSDKIDKSNNDYTHIQDALQYACLGIKHHFITDSYGRSNSIFSEKGRFGKTVIRRGKKKSGFVNSVTYQ